ncbi:MAG: glycosyltransferase family 4 protein [Bacteroidales bacterium]|nr:glycosyltransferase family 4 protein [Bacteroidales bacterium]
MKILIISHYAGSPKLGMAYRPYYLAKEWIKAGHEVCILAADNSHLRNKNIYFQKDFHEQEFEKIKYIWVKTPKYKGNNIGRIFNILVFVIKSVLKAKFLSQKYKPDVVIASSTYPLDNYIAYKICKISKAKYIFEVHDLWPLSPIELGGFPKYHPFIIVMQKAEDFAYKNADSVVSMLPKTKEHMKEHGLDLSKWHHIPNGILTEEWGNSEKIPNSHKQILDKLKKEKKIIVGYAGGHAISNSLDTLINAAYLLKDNNFFTFVLVGKGSEKEKLIKQSKDLKNIIFLDAVSKNSIPDLLSYMDILFIGWNKSPLYRFGVSPNKIFDYMMAKKPILHAVDAGNDIVKDAKAGISIKPESPQEIVKALFKFKEMDEKEKRQMGINGFNYVIKYHDYKVLAEEFINIINSIPQPK